MNTSAARPLIAILVVGLALAAAPWLNLPAFYISFLYLLAYWTVLATSWNILSGYSGYFSFGHGAFFGVGIYTGAVLSAKLDWPFLWTLPVAAALAGVVGLTLGLVVFRNRALRGEVFALLTLAVTFVLGTIVLNTPIDGGPGVSLSGVDVPAIAPNAASAIYLMALAAAVLTLATAVLVERSRLGFGLFAIHDDEDVAEVIGVPTLRYKLIALFVSSALAGLAGAIHALFISYVTVNETFSITVPLTVVLMSVLGGTRHWFGPAIGAVAITVLQYAFTSADSAIIGKVMTGAILIAVILFMPDGVMAWFTRRRAPAAAATADAGASAAFRAQDDGATRAPAHAASDEPLLVVTHLRKAFKGVKALNDVSFEVRRGEILGLLGPNGSGKSTFINVVSGHFPADGGSAKLFGEELVGKPAHVIAQSGLARTYQIPRPFAHFTVRENVILTAMFGAAQKSRADAALEADRCLAFAGLSARADALPDDLNLHQRKFLELARALAASPRLLLLDEVLSGLTPGEINEAVRLIRRIRDQGATIVFVEHVMHAVMELTDRVIVLNHGRLIAQGKAHDVMNDPEVITAYLGKPHAAG